MESRLSFEANAAVVVGIIEEEDPSEIAIPERLADLLVVLLLPSSGLTFLVRE